MVYKIHCQQKQQKIDMVEDLENIIEFMDYKDRENSKFPRGKSQDS